MPSLSAPSPGLAAERAAVRSAAETERSALAGRVDDADRKYEDLLTALAGDIDDVASYGTALSAAELAPTTTKASPAEMCLRILV